MLCNIISSDIWVTIFYWTHVSLFAGLTRCIGSFAGPWHLLAKLHFRFFFIIKTSPNSKIYIVQKKAHMTFATKIRWEKCLHFRKCYCFPSKCLQKSGIFLPKLFVRKKYFFPWFCKFSISEDILKFTLFRKVLLPLNEKYSGLQHMQLRKSAVDCRRMSQLFRFFFVFLGLRIFTRIYCIWSKTREQNLNGLLSYNGSQFLIMNRFTYPNDLPMPL